MNQNDRQRETQTTTQGDTQEETEKATETWHDFFDQDAETDPTVPKGEKDSDVPWDLFGKVTCENPF